MDINKTIIVGRLTRDMERKVTTTGVTIGRFSIANGYRKKNGDQWVDETNYFDCVIMGKTADSIAQYMTKGRQVGIEGQLRQNRWEQDGQTRSKVEILVDNLQLLTNPQTEQKPASPDAKQPPVSPDGRRGPETFEDTDDEIPF